MGSTSNTTVPLSFRKLMALQPIKSSSENAFKALHTFQSKALTWAPGGGSTAFGGHVYAQAAWAASQTVGQGMAVHNMTGFFILPGRIDVPFIYKVRKVRDGGVYCLRAVEVYQESTPGRSYASTAASEGQLGGKRGQKEASDPTPCFTATVSFKRREDSSRHVDFRYQTPHASADHLRQTYASVLDGKQPEDHPIAPGADALWWTRGLEADIWTETSHAFPGVEIRKVDMSSYNHRLGNRERAGQWRQLSFYRSIKEEDDDDPDGEDETLTLNLHACGHLYASDRNSLFLVPHALGCEDQLVAMSSLSHTVIFHADPAALRMYDQNNGRPTWFVQEAWTENGGANRGGHESRLWKCSGGHGGEEEDEAKSRDEIIATTKQDGMIRIPADSTSLDKLVKERGGRMDRGRGGKL